jgi:hypothetical protein
MPRHQQPERLRRERHDIIVEIERHRVIALKPRFVPDLLTRGGRPSPAWPVPLSSVRRERPHRRAGLKLQIGNVGQQLLPLDAFCIKTDTRWISGQRPCTRHESRLTNRSTTSQQQPRPIADADMPP